MPDTTPLPSSDAPSPTDGLESSSLIAVLPSATELHTPEVVEERWARRRRLEAARETRTSTPSSVAEPLQDELTRLAVEAVANTDHDGLRLLDAEDEARKQAERGRESQAGYRHALDGVWPRYRGALLSKMERVENDPNKRGAVEAARAFAAEGSAEDRGRERFALCLCGGYGTGKTYLATATWKQLVWALSQRSPAAARQCLWTTLNELARAIQDCYHAQAEERTTHVIRRYQSAPVLLLDEIGDLDAQQETEDRRRLLFEVLDYRAGHLLPTLLTTNLTLSQIREQFGGRAAQRVLEMAVTVEMGGRNLRMDG